MLLKQGYVVPNWKSSLPAFCGRYHDRFSNGNAFFLFYADYFL